MNLIPKAILLGPLAVLAPAAQATPSAVDAGDEYRELVKEHRAAMEEYQTEVERLRETNLEEAEAYEASWHPSAAFVELFAEKAAEYEGTDDAVPFLTWIYQNEHAPEGSGLPQASRQALRTLLADHAASESFRRTVQSSGFLVYRIGEERCLAVLDFLVEGAPDEDFELAGTFARGVARVVAGGDDEAGRELARADFLLVQEKGNEEVARQAAGYLFELDNLQVGMVAPDIEGKDLGGVSFKLSDYRGKVVMLDFWGDW